LNRENCVSSPANAQQSKDNIPLAVGVIVFTVFALSLGDALIKLISGNFVIWQIFILRSIIAVPCLVLFMATVARKSFSLPSRSGWIVLRSLLLVFMWISYYVSLPHLSLSVAAASYYTLPIFITLFSAVIAGTKISATGWIAVFTGFAGVVLILKPDVGNFNWYALLPLLSAILYALAMIMTRTKCREDHPLLLSLALNIIFIVVGGIAAFYTSMLPVEARQGFISGSWAAMGLSQWLSMCLLAAAMLIGSIGAAIAYQNGPSSMIGIFDFAYVGFALIWSIVLFNEMPDTTSLLGIALIVAAGILSLRQ